MLRIREFGVVYRGAQLGGLISLLVIALLIPNYAAIGTIGLWSQALILAIAGMGLNLIYGYTGMISIGHSAFFGVGAYASAILVTRNSWSPIATIPVAVVLAFVVGCFVALPAARIKGLYLVLVSMAVGLLFPALLQYPKLTWLTGGSLGLSSAGYVRPPSWASWIVGDHYGRAGLAIFLYWMAIAGTVVAFIICRGVVRGRPGRSLVAIRDQENVAATMGINVPITKLLVFGVSAALCALAGSLTTIGTGVAAPEALYITVFGSIIFLLVMIVGGAGTLSGPIVGAVAYTFLNQYTLDAAASGEGIFGYLFSWSRSSPGTILFGVFIIILMFIAPSGLVGVGSTVFRRFVTIVRRHEDHAIMVDADEAKLGYLASRTPSS